eukprot:TRINITY_DN2174_c0_g3_i4.p1 TRINITY_DN2174_c0_g3~~TRINITY_DN2174_c0_g3_i4.p1  ORF type:complete len:215 (+),score=63.33 TRINITY_DN2174_c0_g3_i4:511-1155(+)
MGSTIFFRWGCKRINTKPKFDPVKNKRPYRRNEPDLLAMPEEEPEIPSVSVEFSEALEKFDTEQLIPLGSKILSEVAELRERIAEINKKSSERVTQANSRIVKQTQETANAQRMLQKVLKENGSLKQQLHHYRQFAPPLPPPPPPPRGILYPPPPPPPSVSTLPPGVARSTLPPPPPPPLVVSSRSTRGRSYRAGSFSPYVVLSPSTVGRGWGR